MTVIKEINMLNEMAVNMAQCYYAQSGKKYDEDDIELYAYGFQILFMKILFNVALIIFGVFIGRLFETVAYLVAFTSLRKYANGHHASTPLKCFLSSVGFYALMLTAIYFIPDSLVNYISLLIIGVSIFPVLKFAPAEHENRPMGPIQCKEFRKKAILVLLIQTTVITLTSVLCIVLSLPNVISYICLSFAIGQFIESSSIVIAKIQNTLKKGRCI